ncbi:MAG: tetratricopeptide repeat protein [Gemmatimonadota bacterium]|nr:tetratricopeptide repeat protein [Gemmatimonadota bacterium]
MVISLVLAGGWFGTRELQARERSRITAKHRLSPIEQLRQRDVQISVWEKALAMDPTSALALGNLAAFHLQRARESGEYADYAKAESLARRSLGSRTQRNGPAFVTLASALLAQHDFGHARAIAQDVTQLYPDTPEYRALLAETQLELGDYADAARAFEGLSASRSGLSIAPRLARWEEIRGQSDRARAILAAALKSAQTQDLPAEQLSWFYLRLGDVEMRSGRTRSARKTLEAGLEATPDDYRLLGALARLEAGEGNTARAIDFGERSLAQRLDPLTLGTLSDIYAARGDSAKSAEYMAALEATAAGQPGPFHRALSLFLLDRNTRVAEVLVKAEEEIKTRKDIYGYDLLGWALYKSHRYVEARAAMRMARRMSTEDAQIYYHTGMVERALGKTAAASDYLERALTINPGFNYAQAKIARATLESLGGG